MPPCADTCATHRAALQGEPTAQSFLCQMHLSGDNLPRDLGCARLSDMCAAEIPLPRMQIVDPSNR
jgi:hypothetical protein